MPYDDPTARNILIRQRIKHKQCIDCGKRIKNGKRRCSRHLKMNAALNKGKSTKIYFERKEAGLCVQCGKYPRGRFLRCQQCRIDLSLNPRDWWTKVTKKGLCAKCKGPVPPSKRDPTKTAFRCEKCAANHAAVMKQHHKDKRQ